MLTVTCDPSANLKLLTRLELEGHIQLWAVNIEEIQGTRRIAPERKQKPIAVWNSPHSTWGNGVWASENTPYKALLEIIGKSHQADVLHLENHIQSGRDLFATSDTDFIKHRSTLRQRFDISIMTAEEIQDFLL